MIADFVTQITMIILRWKAVHTEFCKHVLIHRVYKLQEEFCNSLTWDRTKEFVDHDQITLAADIMTKNKPHFHMFRSCAPWNDAIRWIAG